MRGGGGGLLKIEGGGYLRGGGPQTPGGCLQGRGGG